MASYTGTYEIKVRGLEEFETAVTKVTEKWETFLNSEGGRLFMAAMQEASENATFKIKLEDAIRKECAEEIMKDLLEKDSSGEWM